MAAGGEQDAERTSGRTPPADAAPPHRSNFRSAEADDGRPDDPSPRKSKPREVPGAVLFACTMNAIRSPMAAAILRHLAGQRTYVASAGVRAGPPDPFIAPVMDEIGIDISGHTPHTIAALHDTSFDLVVSLSPEAHHQALELTRTMAVDVEYWPTLDPSYVEGSREQRLEAYRALRDQLFQRIKARFGLLGGPQV